MALVTNLATLDVITEAWVDSVKDGLNTGVFSGTYTPTLVGMAVGTGGSAFNTAWYAFTGGIFTMNGLVTFGTAGTTFPGATVTVTLPTGFTMPYYSTSHPIGRCTMGIAGTNYAGSCWTNSGTTARFVVENVAGTYATVVATSTTVPATWAAGSAISYSFTTPATYA